MRIALLVVSAGVALVGVFALSFGSLWAPDALRFFASHESVRQLELILPFLPILIIASGAFLVVKSRRRARRRTSSTEP